MLRCIPDVVYDFWDYMDDDKVTRIPLRFRVKLTVKDGRMKIDLTGTDPQVRAAYNVPTNGKRNYWITIRLTNFLTTYDLSMPKNAGLYRTIDAVVPPGIVINAEFPDACGVLSSPSLRVSRATHGAIIKAHPGLTPAPSGGNSTPVALAEHDALRVQRPAPLIQPPPIPHVPHSPPTFSAGGIHRTFFGKSFKCLLILTIIECLALVAQEFRIGHTKNVTGNPALTVHPFWYPSCSIELSLHIL